MPLRAYLIVRSETGAMAASGQAKMGTGTGAPLRYAAEPVPIFAPGRVGGG